jgi:biotin carboxyl carrier protein
MDLSHIQVLIDVLKKNGIKNFSLKETDGREISLEFAGHETSTFDTAAIEDRPQKAAVPRAESVQNAIKAEMVGTVYLSVSPSKPKFVEIGSKVRKGQTVCLIEAMKTYFEVKSTQDGTIDKILVEDKEAVDFGKPLFSLV